MLPAAVAPYTPVPKHKPKARLKDELSDADVRQILLRELLSPESLQEYAITDLEVIIRCVKDRIEELDGSQYSRNTRRYLDRPHSALQQRDIYERRSREATELYERMLHAVQAGLASKADREMYEALEGPARPPGPELRRSRADSSLRWDPPTGGSHPRGRRRRNTTDLPHREEYR